MGTMKDGFPRFGRYLNATGRPMVYSCSWPFYVPTKVSLVAQHCNMWRVYIDIQGVWGNLQMIINNMRERSHEYQPVAGPGAWNDPDQLVIGDTHRQEYCT